MSIEKWNTGKELLNFEREFNRFFNNLGDKLSLFRKPGFDEELNNTVWMPLADLLEDKDNYTIKLDLPGMKKEDIKISFSEGILTLSGERKLEKEKKGDTYHIFERSFGKFYRSFRLPIPIVEDSISAVYQNGQLNLTIPKKEESKPKQIEININ